MSSTFRFAAVFKHLVGKAFPAPPGHAAAESVNAHLKALTATADAAAAAGRLESAQRDYEAVLQADSTDLYVCYQLAGVLQRRGLFSAAATVCDQGLAQQPEQAGLLNLRASIASAMGAHRKALECYRQIKLIAPEYEKIDAKLADQFTYLGMGKEALAAFDRAIALAPESPSLQSDRLFVMNFFKLADRLTLFEEHRRWGARHEAKLIGQRQAWSNEPTPHRSLRVGYVSADLRAHAVAFFIEGVLANHDREQVEIHCFDASPYPEDNISRRLQRHVNRWHRIAPLDDAQLDVLIRSLGIDVLVDLGGHTAHNRLLAFARKPAPVQVSWFGYMNTTGLTAIDYRLTDPYMDPVGRSEQFYTEKLFRIPSMACFTPYVDSPAVGPLPAASAGNVTFASVNQWTKVTDEVKDLWGAILRHSRDFRLLIVVRGGNEDPVRNAVVEQFVDRGVTAQQIDVRGFLPLAEFLQLFNEVDIALDPFPYGGGTSSMHSIWMGVPIVTLEGDSEMSRSTSGIMNSVGLPEWVARSGSEYVRIAITAGENVAGLVRTRAGLREAMRSASLSDAVSLTRSVESAFRTMWSTYCEGAAASAPRK